MQRALDSSASAFRSCGIVQHATDALSEVACRRLLARPRGGYDVSAAPLRGMMCSSLPATSKTSERWSAESGREARTRATFSNPPVVAKGKRADRYLAVLKSNIENVVAHPAGKPRLRAQPDVQSVTMASN